MLRKKYPSDLTDTQWELIEKLIEKECPYQGGPKVTLFERINDHLREVARETSTLKKNAAPSVGIIDSQSVKSVPETKGLEVGIDGGKLVKGRKRSIVVDTMGYVICVFVHAANIYGCGATPQNLSNILMRNIIVK
jgi:hypothetical protein